MTPNDSAKTVSSDGSASDTQAAIDYVASKNQDGWVITLAAGKFSLLIVATASTSTPAAKVYT